MVGLYIIFKILIFFFMVLTGAVLVDKKPVIGTILFICGVVCFIVPCNGVWTKFQGEPTRIEGNFMVIEKICSENESSIVIESKDNEMRYFLSSEDSTDVNACVVGDEIHVQFTTYEKLDKKRDCRINLVEESKNENDSSNGH